MVAASGQLSPWLLWWGIGAGIIWAATSKGAKRKRVARAAQHRSARMPLSKVGIKTATGIACPKCGGQQWRSGLLSPSWVRCAACGETHRRG